MEFETIIIKSTHDLPPYAITIELILAVTEELAIRIRNHIPFVATPSVNTKVTFEDVVPQVKAVPIPDNRAMSYHFEPSLETSIFRVPSVMKLEMLAS